VRKANRGATYHAVAEEGIPVRDIASVIGRCLNVPVVAKSPKKAASHFGLFAESRGEYVLLAVSLQELVVEVASWNLSSYWWMPCST
jgi:hypothetical protein